MDSSDTKQINITGQSNRYQIKKLTQEKKTNKKRIEIEKLNLPLEYFTFEKQYEMMNNFSSNKQQDETYFKVLLKQIERKISSYKQQDIDKKVLNNEKIINLKCVIDKLIETEIK